MPMPRSTKGHQPFDSDAATHQGYRYTTTAPTSALTANQRLTQLTINWLRSQKNCPVVMDLGCGDGTYTAALAAAFPRKTFLGCDPAAKAIKLAKKKFPHLSFSVADLLKPQTLPKKNVSASIVRGVIHHVPDAQKGVMTAVQYAPKTLIIEPNGWSPVLKLIEVVSPYHRAHGERSFTSWLLSDWVKAAGGQVTSISYVGFVPFFCPAWLVTPLKTIEPWIEKSWLAPLLCAQVILETQHSKNN